MSPSSSVTRTGQQSPVKFTGNFTPEQQARVLWVTDAILRGRSDFAKTTGSRLELSEVSAYERPEDGKMHAEVVFEIDMDEDMLNAGGNLHGGCTMFLIDVCSSIALLALGIARDARVELVSQAITTVFHAPATVGTRLRIVNKTTSFGARTVSGRTEIWDTTNRRLVATGIHNQMAPSQPKL
ncbi:HotDog domain-containing protein [Ganoderma leucocontextum]|nr:HotDog domain-containing protein [Ganoderma leucocontextum]